MCVHTRCREQRCVLRLLDIIQREPDVPRWGTDRVFGSFWYVELRPEGSVLVPCDDVKNGPVYLVLGQQQSIGEILPGAFTKVR